MAILFYTEQSNRTNFTVAKLLLDCGINKNIINKSNKKAIDLCDSNSQLSFLILEY